MKKKSSKKRLVKQLQSNFDEATHRNEFFRQMEAEMAELIDPATGTPRADLVELISCPGCDDDRGVLFLEKWGFTYQRCPRCSLIYVNPRLREEIAIKLYRHGSISNDMWAKKVNTSSTQIAVNQEYFTSQLALLKKYVSSGRLLDVGCGNGDFLNLARVAGFDCLGLELGVEAVKIARQRGLEILEILLDDSALAGRKFEVITMFGVLEHLYCPKRDLARVFDLLVPGGILLGITPNAFSLAGRLLHNEARFYTPRNHPILFCEPSLRQLLERAGFEVLNIDTVLSGYESIINYLQYRPPFGELSLDDLSPQLKEVTTDRDKFELFLKSYDLGLRLRVIARRPLT